jgi:hypothetical protein
VLNEAGARLSWRKTPHFLESETERLRVAISAQVKALHEFLAAGAARALTKERLSAHNLHASGEGRLARTILANASISRCHTNDVARVAAAIRKEHLRDWRARENVHAEGLSLPTQPSNHLPE